MVLVVRLKILILEVMQELMVVMVAVSAVVVVVVLVVVVWCCCMGASAASAAAAVDTSMMIMMMIPYILKALNRGRGIRRTQIGNSPNKIKASTLNDDLAWLA